MTRPDPRLLCPVDALPFVPEDCARYRCDECGRLYRPHRDWCPICGCEARAEVVDFSAPALRDGLPVRLDALAWGLRALHPEATGARMGDMPNRAYLTCDAKCALSAMVYDGSEWSPHPFKIILNPWPDLSNLSPDDASRAVVVSALKARKVKP